VGKGEIMGLMFIVSIIVTTLLLITGTFYFRRMEKGFADVV
jgi:ABC-type polysaccharide/polyol phosphate export permease